jgi:hypothetical protein
MAFSSGASINSVVGTGASGPPFPSNLDQSSRSSGNTTSGPFLPTGQSSFVTLQTTARATTGNRVWIGIMLSKDGRFD